MKTSLAAIALLTAGSIGLVGSVGKAIAQPQEASDLVLRRVWAGRGADPLGQPSPDGRQLTYMDWSTGNLALRDMTTGETRHLTHKETTDPGYGEFSIVSPDGRHVAYHWYPGAWEFELRIVDLDGSNDRLLIPADECEYCPPRDWSPDGSEILVDISHDNNESVLALVAVEDGSVR
jgi:Tol biopolymer transport system component